jgi:brefeldin A-resistance guanine nucleotide exchange factor 1
VRLTDIVAPSHCFNDTFAAPKNLASRTPSHYYLPPVMSSVDSDDIVASTLQETVASLGPRPISVAVSPVALVVTECITVTSAMRKHARWAHSSVAAILGSSSNKTPAVQRRDRTGQGIISAGEQEEAVPSRWGLRGKKGKSMQDNPLMSAFARLRNDLKGCKGTNWLRRVGDAVLMLR